VVTHIWESWWLESMYILQGETWPIWHIRFPRQSTYARRMLPAGGPRMWQPFAKSSTMMDRATAPKKKGSWHNSQHDVQPIHGSVPSFSPEPAIEVVGVKAPSVDGRLLGLPGPYHRLTVGTFNTCSRVWIPLSLTDTGEGYHTETLE
jgi:hypothetical protein